MIYRGDRSTIALLGVYLKSNNYNVGVEANINYCLRVKRSPYSEFI
ncbi:MAG: hypothetical protein WBA93_16545 [Microcoleaceae cyanobacterium]